jgi:hypothetical protein
LQVFDQPVMETNCTRRSRSTVAAQALSLLNSDFMGEEARALADRVLRESPANPVGHAIRLAFQRPATQAERVRLAAFLIRQAARYLPGTAGAKAITTAERNQANRAALADLCHMLLSANEFAYVD